MAWDEKENEERIAAARARTPEQRADQNIAALVKQIQTPAFRASLVDAFAWTKSTEGKTWDESMRCAASYKADQLYNLIAACAVLDCEYEGDTLKHKGSGWVTVSGDKVTDQQARALADKERAAFASFVADSMKPRPQL